MGFFTKKTVRDINLAGKRVLLRADYNVPHKNGQIVDDYRIRQSLPTIEFILKQKPAALIIISHLGRPKNNRDTNLSLAPVAKRLAHLLSKEVSIAGDCIGEAAKKAAADLPAGGILLFENVRFHSEEEANDKDFAKAIIEAAGAQVFIQDGFGVVHRAHASTEAIAKQLPAVAGLLVEKEVNTILGVIKSPKRPLVAVIGGAKISDKIDVLKYLIDTADCVAVAGALANNFLLAQKIKLGKSLVEPEALDLTNDILHKVEQTSKVRNFNFLIPVDVVVSTAKTGVAPTRLVDIASHTIADIQAYPGLPAPSAYEVAPNEIILDIGPISAAEIAGTIKLAKTIIWNGTCGMAEVKGIAGAQAPFAHGTRVVAEAAVGAGGSRKPYSLAGGGDTVAYIQSQGWLEDFDHISTGGGASLELMAGHKLPGLEVLQDK
ncbi:MAG: phosphoglycerate kinase [Candidatus Saccharimonadales bacterium]